MALYTRRLRPSTNQQRAHIDFSQSQHREHVDNMKSDIVGSFTNDVI